jgi:hypothetical protein
MNNRTQSINHEGNVYAVLWRVAGESKTEPCPFCKKCHTHSKDQGHRIAHCDWTHKSFTENVTLNDGQEVSACDGYFVIDYMR